MFLFWNRISWDTCYDRNCFHSGGFLTSLSLPRHRKPSSGFGIIYSVLTFCRRGLAILIRFDILLGFLIFGSSILLIYITTNIFLTFLWWFPLLIFMLLYIIYALIAITIFSVILYIYTRCIEVGFNQTFLVVLYLFSCLPLFTRINILIYIVLLVYGVHASSLDYTLQATGNNLPVADASISAGNNAPWGSRDPLGPQLPSIRSHLPEFWDDPLLRKCSNQMRELNNIGNRNLPIFDRRYDFDSAIVEPQDQQELLDRYERSGDTTCRISEGRLYRHGTNVLSRMNTHIYDAIRRGR